MMRFITNIYLVYTNYAIIRGNKWSLIQVETKINFDVPSFYIWDFIKMVNRSHFVSYNVLFYEITELSMKNHYESHFFIRNKYSTR